MAAAPTNINPELNASQVTTGEMLAELQGDSAMKPTAEEQALIEAEKLGDEGKYGDIFRKTFITDKQN